MGLGIQCHTLNPQPSFWGQVGCKGWETLNLNPLFGVRLGVKDWGGESQSQGT